MRFYVFALIFIIFDVEAIFLLPWAVVFKTLGPFAFVEGLIFIGILIVGLAYVWRKGDLEWVKPDDLERQGPECLKDRSRYELMGVLEGKFEEKYSSRPLDWAIQLGTFVFTLAARLWAGMLRHRNDGDGRLALRSGSFWRGSFSEPRHGKPT